MNPGDNPPVGILLCTRKGDKMVEYALAGMDNRAARFRTVITWINSERSIQVEGVVDGEMAREEAGNGGFGYDAIFIPKGYNETFATLSQEIKNTISHRARALVALRKAIDSTL